MGDWPWTFFPPSDPVLSTDTAYAVYFDHKRRSDPEFRKALKRESRKEARAAKEEAEAQGAQQKRAIKIAVEEAREEGFPTNVEEKEAYFMSEVGRGETLCQDGMRILYLEECDHHADWAWHRLRSD